ncbi:hypothetical protein H4S08_004878 [Coemansia sp. RSA 1365]|nr:hypothetical protein H4S08_004878 [Coemansia sp. RSA 1365]
MRRNAREVRYHFLSSLDSEVHIMFTGCLPTWLADRKLDDRYAYVSELQESFNTVTQNVSQYAKFHQALDKVDAIAKVDSNWSGEVSWPKDELTAQQVDVFNVFSEDNNLDIEVCMATVEPWPIIVPLAAMDITQP